MDQIELYKQIYTSNAAKKTEEELECEDLECVTDKVMSGFFIKVFPKNYFLFSSQVPDADYNDIIFYGSRDTAVYYLEDEYYNPCFRYIVNKDLHLLDISNDENIDKLIQKQKNKINEIKYYYNEKVTQLNKLKYYHNEKVTQLKELKYYYNKKANELNKLKYYYKEQAKELNKLKYYYKEQATQLKNEIVELDNKIKQLYIFMKDLYNKIEEYVDDRNVIEIVGGKIPEEEVIKKYRQKEKYPIIDVAEYYDDELKSLHETLPKRYPVGRYKYNDDNINRRFAKIICKLGDNFDGWIIPSQKVIDMSTKSYYFPEVMICNSNSYGKITKTLINCD